MLIINICNCLNCFVLDVYEDKKVYNGKKVHIPNVIKLKEIDRYYDINMDSFIKFKLKNYGINSFLIVNGNNETILNLDKGKFEIVLAVGIRLYVKDVIKYI